MTKDTSINAGAFIREILSEDNGVKVITTRIFPISVDEATLPYISYRRIRMQQQPNKFGLPGADTVEVEVNCFTQTYAESVELAEAVRAALDGKQHILDGGLVMRSCYLSDGSEDWQDDAFVQQMIFTIRI